MTAQRRRDPRIPHENPLEDVETVLNGETISYHGLTMADELIIAANQDALDVRRVMWGLDRDDWLLAVDGLRDDGHLDLAITVARKWCDIAVTIRQYDTTEPDPWGFEKLAKLYHRAGDHDAERAVLGEWLYYWPEDRVRLDGARERMLKRLDRKCLK